MAVKNIAGPDTTTLTLSTSFLGSGSHIVGSNCDYITINIDKAAVLAGTYQFTITSRGNGDTLESVLAAGVHKTFRPGRGQSWTLDAKGASGTPKIHVETGLIR